MKCNSLQWALAVGCCVLQVAACGDDDGSTGGGFGGGALSDASTECEGPPGLYEGAACSQLAEGVRVFLPRFALWTDGADKERFLYLPPGETIDTSDPDDWVFPVGTRLYKHFTLEGQRIETRVMTKITDGPGFTHWEYVAYAWNAAQTAVTAVPNGVMNALGTSHDIPSTNSCEQCHAGAARDMGLGVSAIQLNHAMPGVTLASLEADGWLTDPIDVASADVPGDAAAQAGLGYLHANCGHCHGGASAPAGLRMRLLVADETVEGTDTYTTAVGAVSAWQPTPPPIVAVDRIRPGEPSNSSVYLRMNIRGPGQMPSLGTETTDTAGLEAVEAFINGLPSL